mmetsp:Transcript_22097/g.75762  ORF Transcript_22097/g.75762 Transcript_22097/m.75762 type:complete len:339 (-) Transcript_22097:101-1117(-)
MDSYTFWSQPQVSNLFTATTSCEMPRDRASCKCSFVCPPRSKPASKCETSTTTSATSACTAPCNMFGTKSRCPGASKIVNRLALVSKCLTQTSIVTPRSRSSSPSSKTQAKAKDALPICFDSFSNLCSCLDETVPTRQSRCPMRVDFPASTWPMTTKLMFGLASDGSSGGIFAEMSVSSASSSSAGGASDLTFRSSGENCCFAEALALPAEGAEVELLAVPLLGGTGRGSSMGVATSAAAALRVCHRPAPTSSVSNAKKASSGRPPAADKAFSTTSEATLSPKANSNSSTAAPFTAGLAAGPAAALVAAAFGAAAPFAWALPAALAFGLAPELQPASP